MRGWCAGFLLLFILPFESSRALDFNFCGQAIRELKSFIHRQRNTWEKAEFARRESIELNLHGFSNRLREWAKQPGIPREWILELPIDWEATIKSLGSSDSNLETIAMIMRLFRDYELTPKPDALEIQEDWITWANKQPVIAVTDKDHYSILARRAQMAFLQRFQERYALAEEAERMENYLRLQLNFLSSGWIDYYAKQILRFSTDPDDLELAQRAVRTSEALRSRYLGFNYVLTALERKILTEKSNDRNYISSKVSEQLEELDTAVQALSDMISTLEYQLYTRAEDAVGADVIKFRRENAQKSVEISLVNAARDGDTKAFENFLSLNMVPPLSVRDHQGRDLKEIAASRPEILKILDKYLGPNPFNPSQGH